MSTVLTMTSERTPVHWTHKSAVVIALVIGAGLFASIGTLAAAPIDPRGAVSLLTHAHPIMMFVQVTALAIVTAIIATALVGQKWPDVGLFSAALGMGLVTLYGATASYLFIVPLDGNTPAADRGMALRMLAAGVVWSVSMAITLAVSAVVMRFFAGSTTPPRCLLTHAAGESPLRAMLGLPAADAADKGWYRLRAWLMTTGVAVFAYLVLVSGYQPRWVHHGQIVFAVFAAFYLGVWAAKRTFPARTAWWPLLAVPTAYTAGCLGAIVWPRTIDVTAQVANLPSGDFLRALPLTFVSVAVLGVLCAHWTIAPSRPPTPASKRTPRQTSRR